MFRLTHYVRQLVQPRPVPVLPPMGPVVIWNLTRRCNLKCSFCYAFAADGEFPGELTTDQAFAVVDDLARARIRMLILSGGEPLLRRDIFEVAARARDNGLRMTFSSNGCLMTPAIVEKLVDLNMDYVGISLDGIGEVHDKIRGKAGAFDEALRGIRLCRDAGLKTGIRFTLTEDNMVQLGDMLRLVGDEGVGKFYLSHLNYAGRGNNTRKSDVYHNTTRGVLRLLMEESFRLVKRGINREIVTGNNDADGAWFLLWVKSQMPERYDEMYARLARWGGNATGIAIANIDNLGRVHPDSMWWHHTLGNVLERPFSEIWADPQDDLMTGLRANPRPLKGRCGTCTAQAICNGNTRTRAWQVHRDVWASDPGCYLHDDELAELSAPMVAAV